MGIPNPGPAPLLGRHAELRRITAALDGAAPGRPHLLILDGPRGSGRSRLLAEAAAAARARGFAVTAEPDGAGSGPLLVIRDGPLPVAAGFWAALHRPADRQTTRVVVVAPGPAPAGVPVADVVRPAPLGAADVRRLLTHLLGARPDPAVLDLARVAAGRPGPLHDLVTGWRDEGLLRVAAGRAALWPPRLPDRTRSWLAGELAALSPGARHLLQAATTLAGPFRLVELTGLLRVRPVQVLPAVDEALGSGLLTGDGEHLRFAHELVRALVEASLPGPVAAALREERRRYGARRTGAAAHPRPRCAAPPPAPGPVDWSRLSARERQIAELAGRALTNRQIATRVGRSPHTVNYHLRNIFQKLGLTSRVELAVLLRPDGAGRPPASPSSS